MRNDLCLLICLLIGLAPRLPADEIDFEASVRPILDAHCVSCHGADESNGGLRFDHAEGAFVEGDSGSKAIVPGDPSNSELLVRIRSRDEDTQMPPEGERLSKSEIKTLTEWIQKGASWPKDLPRHSSEPTTTHWAFQPIAPPTELPTADDWSTHPIDRLLQVSRYDRGLTVTNDASPRTVLRRLSYDLTGLPPTAKQVDGFLAQWENAGPEAAIRGVVDGLLGTREYGERWGRHWMDWVRYADTAGDNSDFPIPQAYLYRNYIIESINDDVPYDRFLIEQLAGDLLPAKSQEQRNRQVIATGYLAMARRFGSLIETYPWHLTIEDTIDNVGRTMMGLTLSCARCHDHKFDPISTREYYGLYGFFASTQYAFPGVELFKAQNHFVSLLPPEKTTKHLEKYSKTTKDLQSKLDKQLEVCRRKAEDNARKHSGATIEEQRRMHQELQWALGKGRNLGQNLSKHLISIPDYPTAYAVSDAKPVNAPIQIKGEPDRPGAVVPRQFPKVLGGQKLPDEIAESGSGRLELAHWIASKDNPLTARVIVNRVWQRYFGRGIVATTTDFGLRGQKPDQPELLDWLAQDLIDHDWSLKHLHRRILTSRTYRLSSNVSESHDPSLDPDNVALTYQRRKRLDAESIRDTMLLLSGKLDREPMTEPHPFPPRNQWKYTQHGPFNDSYESNKRSVYLMMKRLTADKFFQTFDGPDRNVCTQSREQSITPLQALYFVNNEFLHQQAALLVESLPREQSDTQRVTCLVEKVLLRDPTERELDLFLKHFETVKKMNHVNDKEAWSSVVRTLFRLNEFVYVD